MCVCVWAGLSGGGLQCVCVYFHACPSSTFKLIRICMLFTIRQTQKMDKILSGWDYYNDTPLGFAGITFKQTEYGLYIKSSMFLGPLGWKLNTSIAHVLSPQKHFNMQPAWVPCNVCLCIIHTHWPCWELPGLPCSDIIIRDRQTEKQSDREDERYE